MVASITSYDEPDPGEEGKRVLGAVEHQYDDFGLLYREYQEHSDAAAEFMRRAVNHTSTPSSRRAYPKFTPRQPQVHVAPTPSSRSVNRSRISSQLVGWKCLTAKRRVFDRHPGMRGVRLPA
jgi:hypothetical protein